MNYAARLAKLERLAGKGSCPQCRLFRRHTWLGWGQPRPKPKDPALLITDSCDLCGATITYEMSRAPADLLEITRLYSTTTLTDTFTNPRAWAAREWMSCFVTIKQVRRRIRRAAKKGAASGQAVYQHQQRARERERARAKNPDVKLYNDLLAEWQAAVER